MSDAAPARPQQPGAEDSPSSGSFSLPLETLRTLHAAASARWVNRREYEWKLTYAVWVALAGFIATVVLGKDSNLAPLKLDFHSYPAWFLLAFIAMPACLHGYYLNGMVQRTINDLDLTDDIEHVIKELDPWVKSRLKLTHFNSDFLKSKKLSKRYGMYAQLGITMLLSVAAVWFLNSDRQSKPSSAPQVNVSCPLGQQPSAGNPESHIPSKR